MNSRLEEIAASAPEPESADAFATRGRLLPRFVDPAVEQQFRQNSYQAAARTRVICYLFGAIVALLMPLSAKTTLAQAPELVPVMRFGALALDLPFFLFAAWVSSLQRLPLRYASALQIGLLYLIELHAEVFRLQAARHGAEFPGINSFVGLLIALIVFGLPLRQMLVALVLFFVCAKGVEFALMPLTPSDYMETSADLLFVALMIIAAMRAEASRREAFARLGISEQRAYVDQLTRLPNRWGFQKDADRIVRHAARERHPITIAIVDLDHFKRVNDSAGHAFGDFVLTQVANCLSTQVRRPLDTLGRVGGEEFVLLWYAPREDFSMDVGEQLVAAVRALDIRCAGVAGAVVTISVGVATLVPRRREDLARLTALADECLYEAKAAGRNTARGRVTPP